MNDEFIEESGRFEIYYICAIFVSGKSRDYCEDIATSHYENIIKKCTADIDSSLSTKTKHHKKLIKDWHITLRDVISSPDNRSMLWFHGDNNECI